MPKHEYHSALWPPAPHEKIDRHELQGSVAFQHDIYTDPLTADYESCDVIYSELPWRAGFDRFNRRAAVHDQREYPQFLVRVSAIVEEALVPVILVMGKNAVSRLPLPDYDVPILLNGAPARALSYGVTMPAGLAHDELVIEWLTTEYDRVGDFCAGFGRTGRHFAEVGKSFVLSDFNARCIGYIAEHMQEWFD